MSQSLFSLSPIYPGARSSVQIKTIFVDIFSLVNLSVLTIPGQSRLVYLKP